MDCEAAVSMRSKKKEKNIYIYIYYIHTMVQKHFGLMRAVSLQFCYHAGTPQAFLFLEIKDSLEDEIDESGPKIFRIAQFHGSLVDKPFLRPYFWGGTLKNVQNN